jgi:hypothetical protein
MTEWRVISRKRESKARARRNAAADVRSDTDTDADAGFSAGRSCKVTSQLPRVVNSEFEIRNPKFEIRGSMTRHCP